MLRDICFILIGYISGSILYARIFGNIIAKKDITNETSDKNPGTSNAFKNGGLLCGSLTLFCDVIKGFLPVFLYCSEDISYMLAFVLAAPVIGHIFPVFYKFRGGKGIATTFGCLLGYSSGYIALLALAFWYIFFVLIVNIKSNYHKTFAAYIFTEITLMVLSGLKLVILAILIGFSLILAAVIIRLLKSDERKEPLEVKLLWMH